MDKYICIHGHFYQPPRENPWLEEIEVQDSAHPYHDWNERIAAECYAPNGFARILDNAGNIIRLVNNYARTSFDFGPTLLAWLEHQAPDVYEAILVADRESRERFSGHGSAIAQCYNHIVMPLASRADKLTQVVWGLKDFEIRFGRAAEGMWLPETAIDVETLEILAAQGVRFTILSPRQAARIRRAGESAWQEIGGGVLDVSQPYRHPLPSGASIDIFFFDAEIAQQVAFGTLLTRGEDFADRLLAGFRARGGPQLVHIANDGESYGHHKPHGDMALASALERIETSNRARLTNYGEFLERHPPEWEVETRPNTSWTCPAGVERWRSSCSCCKSRPQANTSWKAPLRAAFNRLREAAQHVYDQQAPALLNDPTAALHDYIRAMIDRSPPGQATFIRAHATRNLSEDELIHVRKLLEMQRHAQLMFSSCGWHFDGLDRIETVQVVTFAGRVVQLIEELYGFGIEGEFLEQLAMAKGGPATLPDAAAIYTKLVRTARLDWDRVAAHYAVSSLFQTYQPQTRIFAYQIDQDDFQSLEAGRVKLVVGRARFRSEIVGEAASYAFAAIHFGDHNVNCGVRRFVDLEGYQEVVRRLQQAFDHVDYPQIIRLMDRDFGESSYSLASLFRDEQRKVLKQVLRSSLAETASTYAKLYEQQLPLMRFLTRLGVPLPKAFLTAAEFLFNTDLRWALADDDPDFDHIHRLVADAATWNVELDTSQLGYRFTKFLARMGERWREQPENQEVLDMLVKAVGLAREMPFPVNLWKVQNVYYGLAVQVFPEMERRAEQADEAAEIWLPPFAKLGELLQVRPAEQKKNFLIHERLATVAEIVRETIDARRVPRATYRIQFRKEFPFSAALEILPYLADLGISELYASPILLARPGSPHGYDVCDHGRINPELGGEAGFDALSSGLKSHGLGLILDTVPNHMCVHAMNGWWMDVLENGISSRYAGYFDIEWNPVNPDLKDKVLLPILGEQYGQILESGQLVLSYEDGLFFLQYYENKLPVAPRSTARILGHALPALTAQLGDHDPHVQELESILTALRYLPPREELSPERTEERYREKEVIRRRVQSLVAASGEVRAAIEASIHSINGVAGQPTSFNELDELIDLQSYRPAFWRVAMEEINYRRFFDINELAAIRMELPEVFEASHAIFMRLLAEGKASGLRIDHPDGLRDPTSYFRQLQESFVAHRVAARLGGRRVAQQIQKRVAAELQKHLDAESRPIMPWPLYVVAEKILTESEPLPQNWAVAGTTGYDFLAAVNAIFVDEHHREEFDRIYSWFRGPHPTFEELVTANKKMTMLVAMVSEINSLSHQLDRIAERNRIYRDFTLNSLTFAIREIIACLPVYRTYITAAEPVSERDNQVMEKTVEEAKLRNPRTAEAIFDFIRDTVLLRNLLSFRELDRPRLVEWSLRFQQLTGPIMAKGVEDTSFYVYNRLVSLNEVGGEPVKFGASILEFHEQNADRLRRWPHSMLATSTHDTKRSEDVRARIAVLSEMPDEWEAALARWREINSRHLLEVDGRPAPEANDRYLLYQTLVGAWPVEMSFASPERDAKQGGNGRAAGDAGPAAGAAATRPVGSMAQPGLLGQSGSSAQPEGASPAAGSSSVATLPFDAQLQRLATEADPARFAEFRARIQAYMQKATKEAKVRTSWINPHEEYDQAIHDFIDRLLDDRPGDPFRSDCAAFAARVAFFGWINSLAQTVLKLTVPGVPDIYQGTELWDYSLVDPDNRRPVDFSIRRDALAEIRQADARGPAAVRELAETLLAALPDGRIKLFALYQLLAFRRQHEPLFAEGAYIPLTITGTLADHVCAFARQHGEDALIVVVPIRSVALTHGREVLPIGPEIWQDHALHLPDGVRGPFVNLFTQATFDPNPAGDEGAWPLASIFEALPFAAWARIRNALPSE